MRNVIDFHHHWMPREHVERLERYLRPREEIVEVTLSDGQVSKRIMRDGMAMHNAVPSLYSVDERLEHMDQASVAAAVFTLGTYTSWVDNIRMSQEVNDAMAKVVSQKPSRFFGAAHVPLTSAGAQELERCAKDYGFVAFSTVTSVQGMFPDNDVYSPLYEVAQEYNLPVIVHAPDCPVDEHSLRDYDLSRRIGREVEHTIAVARVLLSSVLDRFPRLIFIHCHLGGTFWASTSRYGKGPSVIKSRTVTSDESDREEALYERRIKNMYFNTTFWEPPVIKFAIDSLGDDHIVFGSDYPITTSLMSDVGGAIDRMGLSGETLDKIAFGNAERIYGRSLVR
jgi:predicted TIM-barrel fold metal-dependent hydrolase